MSAEVVEIIIFHFLTKKDYLVLLDEAKFSFFSSVILVCVITIRDKVTNYKSNIQKQFDDATKRIKKIEDDGCGEIEEVLSQINNCLQDLLNK